MKSRLGMLLASLLAVLTVPAFPRPLAGENKPDERPKLKVGDVAPDFKLQYFDGKGMKDVTLSEYRGKKSVVLAFYIFAFTGG
jgi:hypothetical protein